MYKRFVLPCWADAPADRPTFAELEKGLAHVGSTHAGLAKVTAAVRSSGAFSRTVSAGGSLESDGSAVTSSGSNGSGSAITYSASAGAGSSNGVNGASGADSAASADYLGLVGNSGAVLEAHDEVDEVAPAAAATRASASSHGALPPLPQSIAPVADERSSSYEEAADVPRALSVPLAEMLRPADESAATAAATTADRVAETRLGADLPAWLEAPDLGAGSGSKSGEEDPAGEYLMIGGQLDVSWV